MAREKDKREGARATATVALTLLWIGVGNALLHLDVFVVYVFAALVAVATWSVLKALARP